MFPIRKFICFFLAVHCLQGEKITITDGNKGTKAKFRILLLNGPNLNLLGSREPDKYGHATLAEIVSDLSRQAATLQADLDHFQSNAEHELINRIHKANRNNTDFIIINPAAFTHTSIALRDALLGVNIPFIEVHISNVHARETFRQHSYLSDKAVGVISGLGALGYRYALDMAIRRLSTSKGE